MLSYVELSRKNLAHNIKALKSLLPSEVGSVAVVKANAYGHGQNEVAKILKPYVDYFQVDDLLELRLLREVTDKPVLVFGYVPPEDLEETVALNGILGLYDMKRLRVLNKIGLKAGKKIATHIKIDSCLGRQGVLPENLDAFIPRLKKLKNIHVAGFYSHFANIEDTSDFTHAQKQIDTFNTAVKKFRKAGFRGFKIHMSATSGVLVYDADIGKGDFDLVRFGIGLYGLWPSEDLRKRYGERVTLKPVLRWVTHIAQVKTVPKGFTIGYGLTYVSPKKTKIAVIPQGYSDGYDRKLSNTGNVLIKGVRCPVLGRVAMNMFVVAVSDVPKVKAGEEVVLLGRQGKEEITAEEIATQISTINYEVVTRVWPRLPRIIA